MMNTAQRSDGAPVERVWEKEVVVAKSGGASGGSEDGAGQWYASARSSDQK